MCQLPNIIFQVCDGNTDQETVVSNWLAIPPVSRYVRLHPKTWNEHIALRLDYAGRFKGINGLPF